MSLLSDRDLGALLKELKNTDRTDKEGCHDYAFLEETIFPTLLPALVQLSENVEKMNIPPMPAAPGLPPDPNAYNPLRSLAEILMRQHPEAAFKNESVYSKHLEKIAGMRREQRLQRELLIKEMERKEEEEVLKKKLEQSEKEEQEEREREEARAQALTKKLADRTAASLLDAEYTAGPFRNVMQLRERCMEIIAAYDFPHATSTEEVDALIYKETCKMLVTDSNATFVGVGRLNKPGLQSTTLHYHTAADKQEFEPPEEEEPQELAEGEEAVERPPPEAPPPQISTRDLPPSEDEMALVLKRGNGITWEPVVDGIATEDEEGEITREKPKPKYVADAKFTEGMFFFEEKRSGTYLAVPVLKDGEVIGVICGDTLDSVLGSELQENECAVFVAAAAIMQKCLNYAEWCLLDARRTKHTRRLEALVKDPRTLPADFSNAFVSAIDTLLPGMHVAVGVFDTDLNMRLVCNKMHDGTTTQDEEVTADDTREHATMMFDSKSKRECIDRKSSNEENIIAMAAPVQDANTYVSAVLYIATDPKAKPPHEDILDFLQFAATLAKPVLLAPAPNAMRVLGVLAAAGTGDPKELYETAGLLCKRYTRAAEVFIACSHGLGGLRVLYQAGSKLEGTIARSDHPACNEAMNAQSSAVQHGYVAAPLVRKGRSGEENSFGVLALHSGELLSDSMAGMSGISLRVLYDDIVCICIKS
jgi:hypothetical protein